MPHFLIACSSFLFLSHLQAFWYLLSPVFLLSAAYTMDSIVSTLFPWEPFPSQPQNFTQTRDAERVLETCEYRFTLQRFSDKSQY